MKVKFWGTRGSIPTPGKETVRYGGNTPCVEVRLPNGNLIIFDAGTGIRGLGDALTGQGESVKAFIAITHPHWDHIQGFPFFKPAFISGNELTVLGPQSRYFTLRQMIAYQMNKVYFPIQLSELKAKLKFQVIREQSIPVYGGTLQSIYVNHPELALGFRLNIGGHSLVYISDNEPFDGEVARSVMNVDKRVIAKYLACKGDPNQRIFDFARGADVVIHDTTYTPEEYVAHVGWGHSHYLFSLKVAEEAQVRKLVLFHHDPKHSDDKIDEILNKCQREIRIRNYSFERVAAAEGMEVEW
ncbi:MAG: MBL fold metallo-hydrolase [Bacteroidota bacterium]